MKERVMKNIIEKVKVLGFGLVIFAALGACDNPFKAGLGPVKDLRPPTVTLELPSAGSFLRDAVVFNGHAEDDYKLDRVEVRVTNYPEYIMVDGERTDNPFFEYIIIKDFTENVTSASSPIQHGDWSFDLDTHLFNDGDLKIKIRVFDSVGKSAETNDIAYYVKNNPPLISLSIPAVVQGVDEGELGSRNLNYRIDSNTPSNFPRLLDSGGLMAGAISDNQGINKTSGSRNIGGHDIEMFPPQIRFWQIKNTDDEAGTVSFDYNYIPTETEVPWVSESDRFRLVDISSTDMQFIYSLPRTSDRLFAFQIRAQGRDGTDFNYPRDYWSPDEWNSLSPAQQRENSVVIVYLRAPEELPVVDFWRLEAIDSFRGWNSIERRYNDYNIGPNDYHPFVDKILVNKKGPFTLRIKASHPEGISTAAVYWEKDGEKGRFIWDAANTDFWTDGFWNPLNSVPINRPYNTWGYNDPHSGAAPTIRSFIYTYLDTGNETVPSGAHAAVAGRSRIQVFTGNADRWLDPDLLEIEPPSSWTDLDRLDEGTYNINVFTRSNTGLMSMAPASFTIVIDKQVPEIELNSITGGNVDPASADPLDPDYIVNGVIRPNFLISESKPTDSQFRTGTQNYFLRADTGRYSFEQVYLIIHENDKALMDAYISANDWLPIGNATMPGGINIPGLTVLKDGPIVDSGCLIKTSPIYAADTDVLADGAYWLYVLARDNAFNVGHNSFKIIVDRQSDIPVIDFTVGSINKDVTDPNSSADGTESGFKRPNGEIHNRFTANSSIRVRFRDDDSLDLGDARDTSEGDSSVKITFVGSSVSADGVISAITDPAYILNFTQADIKHAFAPQPTYTEGTSTFRRAVRERQGEISQAVLLRYLKDSPVYDYLFGAEPGDSPSTIEQKKAGYLSLPDGIYQLSISVSDYTDPRIKLIMPEPALQDPAIPASVTYSFWIAVDSNRPHIDMDSVNPPSGRYISAVDTVTMTGTVSDENGPITVERFGVFDGRTPVTAGIDFSVNLIRRVTSEMLWVYDFNAPMNMNGISGTFTFEITFSDRFGNETTLSQRYSVDDIPPTVGLTKMIDTFERDMADVTLSGPQLQTTPAYQSQNKRRLANKVINFRISATDNFKVEGLRWWLLPVNYGSTGPDATFAYGQLLAAGSGGGQVLDYNAFPATRPDIVPGDVFYLDHGAYGEIDMTDLNFTVFIDTEKLNEMNGEYRLHIIAIDSAGNISRASENAAKEPTSNLYQEIFILQEEDRPYFGAISPASSDTQNQVIGDSGLIVRGTIFDDDGFGPFGGYEIAPETLRIWFSNKHDATDDHLDTANQYIGRWIPPGHPDLTRQGRNINLSVDLRSLFSGAEIGTDGVKHYVVEVHDAPVNKWNENGTADTVSRVSRTKYFSFIYDNEPPRIALTKPANGDPYGPDASDNLVIEGFMQDANLRKDADGRFYFNYRLDRWTENKTHVFTPGTYTEIQVGGDTRIEFTIPSNAAYSMLEFGTLPDGPHTLTLIAEDFSGKESSFSVTFIKDVDPPNFSFTNIDTVPLINMGAGLGSNWWEMPASLGGNNQQWNDNKHTWLNNNPLSVIYYDTSRPILTGTFEDEVSDINIGSFRYWIDGDNDTQAAPYQGTAVFDGSGRNVRWTIYLTENGTSTGTPLPDGVHSIRFQIADSSGNASLPDTMYAFRIDSKQPTASIDAINGNAIASVPVILGPANGFGTNVIAISGKARDANLKDLEIKIIERGALLPIVDTSLISPIPSEIPNITVSSRIFDPLPSQPPYASVNPVYFEEEFTWEYRISNTLYSNNSLYKDGSTYDIIVSSLDLNDENNFNRSEEVIWTFTKDISSPSIAFANLVSVDSDGFTPQNLTGMNNNINILTSESPRIQGSISDGTSAISALQSRIEMWDWDNGRWNTWNGSAFTYIAADADKYWEDIIPTGLAGNTSQNIQWTRNLRSTVSGELNIEEGLFRIWVRGKDVSWVQNGNDGWTDTGLLPRGNPAYSEYVYFYYDRNNPIITFDEEVESFYSSNKLGGVLRFEGQINDANRFRSVTAEIVNLNDTSLSPPRSVTVAPANLNTGAAVQPWVTSIDMAGVIDSQYRLRITATDMAGRQSVERKTFFLDNTPPEGAVTYPELVPRTDYPYSSEIIEGGIGSIITGTSRDTPNANRAESGIESLWYHIGFIDGSTDWPTADALANNVLTGRPGYTGVDTGIFNEYFDQLVESNGNAWFKLGGTPSLIANNSSNPFPSTAYVPMVPTGFVINAPNIFDWRFEIPNQYPNPASFPPNSVAPPPQGSGISIGDDVGGVKQYVSDIIIKGRTYNSSGNPALKLVDKIPETIVAGVYRMPLWVRISDNAGNISYFCRDIWIYPDGDIPSTTILNPVNSDATSPRGGTITGDGVAKNNWAVDSVVFRVKADNYANSTIASPGPAPSNDRIIRLTGLTELTSTDEELDFIANEAGLSRDGWYYANLEAPRGSPEIPWSFTINGEREITERIATWGFNAGSGVNDTIRVWIEVFVFRGDGRPEKISIHDGTIDSPNPYVRFLYLKESAPSIGEPRIGNSTVFSDIASEIYTGSQELRRGSFAIRATLDASVNQTVTQVSIRRAQEENRGWVTAWENGTLTDLVPGVRITPIAGPAGQRYYIDLPFNSTAIQTTPTTPPPTGYSFVRGGDWSRSGGRYPIEIRIRDNASPPGYATFNFEIGIDNFAPMADPDHVTSSKVAGTDVDFLGRVYDYSTALMSGSPNAPREADMVYAWFTKEIGGTSYYVNMNNGSTSTNPGTATSQALRDRNAVITKAIDGDTVTSITIPAGSEGVMGTFTHPSFDMADPSTGGNEWIRVISERAALPGSRMLWIPNNVWDIKWQFTVNTTLLPDGFITLHYIVVDKAGNASYYTQLTSIRNNYPQIDRITLYTDNRGIGAVYTTETEGTNLDEVEMSFVLDDYRSQMFANYTDPSDYGRIEEVGYLNTGFIAKNQFLGFKVESSFGNPDLHYRLQYVTREKIPLTRANLLQMVADRNNPARINLYTIAWHGDYSSQRWATLGVTTTNPTLGTHFVLQMTEVPSDYPLLSSAEVWRYTPLISKADVTLGTDSFDNNLPVLPNDSNFTGEPGHGFNFKGGGTAGGDFNDNWTTPNAAKIGEFDGSHPYEGGKPDNPRDTAFFLVRIWDTVNPVSTDENEMLYDAVVVGMNIYLRDTENPDIRLYDFNPYTETAVIGNNIGDTNKNNTISAAIDPRGTGENILRGGLFNTGTARELMRSGHIEPRNGTSALMPRVLNASGQYVLIPADSYETGDGDPVNVTTGFATNQYSNGTTVARDLVSGKVILRGHAFDNQLIREIRIQIGGTAPTGTNPPLFNPNDPAGRNMAILRLDKSGTAATNPNFRTLQPVWYNAAGNEVPPNTEGASPVQAAAFEMLHWKTGHTVEWAYVWDTERRPNASGTPAENVNIWVAVIDELGSDNAGLPNSDIYTIAQETADLSAPLLPDRIRFHNTAPVDIVPYITGFERQTPKFSTSRSRQGWYSFYQGETGISALGFNLRGSANSTMNIQYNATQSYPLTMTGTQTVNRITFNIPNPTTTNTAYGTSGKIILNTNVTVNGSTEALNHRSRDTQSWNKEYHTFTDGSDLWINKPYAHIWRSSQEYTAAAAVTSPPTVSVAGQYLTPYTFMGLYRGNSSSIGAEHPGMALQFNDINPGRLHGAYSIYGRASTYYGYAGYSTTHNPNSVSVSNGQNSTGFPGEPMMLPDISLFNGIATPNLSNAATNAANANAANIAFTYQGDGAASILMRSQPHVANTSTTTTAMRASLGGSTQRWQNVRISKALINNATAEGSAGRVYVTAWDGHSKSLWFGIRNNTTNTDMIIDGTRTNTGGSGTYPAYITGTLNTVSNAAGIGSGQYSAVGFTRSSATDANPLPVVAYYDDTTDTLRLAYYAGTANPPTAANWVRKEILTGPLRRGSGKYVSMAVDNNNFIHLAFFNSTYNTVVYAVGRKEDASFTAYTVDNVVRGGAWTDISVDNSGNATTPANPTIVYADSARIGNYDGVRIAYKSSVRAAATNPGNKAETAFTRGLNCPVTGTSIAGWEALSMPSDYQVKNDRLNVEVWPPANRGATLGARPIADANIWNNWSAAVGYAADMFRLAYFYAPAWMDGNY